MILRSELQNYLDTLLQSHAIWDYGPNGLQVEGKETINHICFAVSASLSAIEEALSRNADALIVHHGLFWQKEKETLVGSKKKKLKLLLENDVSLFAYHLPLDKHEELGNNWKAARDLQMTELAPFGKFGESKPVFIGVKGNIKPTRREAFVSLLEKYYNHPATSVFGGPEVIQTVGIISGGAYRSVVEGAQERLDAFITGNFDEPVWSMAVEEGINFFALGHHATERIGPIALCEHIQKRFNISCSFIDSDNPF